MSREALAFIEEDLTRALAGTVAAEALRPAALARAIVDRSRRYTSERDALSRPEDPDGDLAARALFFTVVDCPKVRVPLRELAAGGTFPRLPVLRVVDVGAGCGAMSLGLLWFLGELGIASAVELELIDRDARALAIAHEALLALALRLSLRLSLRTTVADVTRQALAPADLVVAGSVLNELPEDQASRLLESLVKTATPDGAVIVIEPALRATTRQLHAARDRLLASGQAHVFAPCIWQGPCPMLENDRDWCHEERGIDLPPAARQLAHSTGLRDGAMKFSYLVLRRQPGTLGDGAAVRAVSPLHSSKGKREVQVCGARGGGALRLLAKHRTDDNRGFERVRRGDLVMVEPSLESAGGDITDAQRVRLTNPGAAATPELVEPGD